MEVPAAEGDICHHGDEFCSAWACVCGPLHAGTAPAPALPALMPDDKLVACYEQQWTQSIMEQLEFRGRDLLWQKSEMWANEVHLENPRMGHFTLRLTLKWPHKPGETYVKLSSQSSEWRRKERPDTCLWALSVSLLKAWTLNRDGMADTGKWYRDRIVMSKRTSPISKITAKCMYKLNDYMSPISHDNPIVLESHIAYYLSWVFHF